MSVPVFRPPPAELVAAFRAADERRLTAEEFDAWANAPLDAEELEQQRDAIRWFTRRFPNPVDRVRWSRAAWWRARRRSPG